MRQGYLDISNELYVDNYDMVKAIFITMRPYHIEYNYFNGNTERTWRVYGICEAFDEIEEAGIVPQYVCSITIVDETGNTPLKLKAEFKRT